KIKIYKKVLILTSIIIVLLISIIFITPLKEELPIINNLKPNKFVYLASESSEVVVYNSDYSPEMTLIRGVKVELLNETIKNSETDIEYSKIKHDKKIYLIDKKNYTNDENTVVKEKIMYVRTPITVYKDYDSIEIVTHIKKGEKIDIIGYDYIKDNGAVNMYKISYNDYIGFAYSKYLVANHEESIMNYDEENTYKTHLERKNTLGGGSAGNLDYFPVSKPQFDKNIMPTEVRSLYLNAVAIKSVDKYISFAKENNINAFVVDIKDNTMPAYKSEVMRKYSPTNYNNAHDSFENYKSNIRKLIDEGFYVIGRITVFKDNYYAKDHPENAIKDTRTNQAFNHDNSYWPSAFKRDVWEFNVALAIEAVTDIGFNEIQFDYIRFPDRTYNLEKAGHMDFQNDFNEDKAQAIQNFLFYATDKIHEVGAYVSADVFGESAHNYVTGYGQYWAAISNVVDVISGMPYPDHFSKHDYNFEEVVWTVPYKLLNHWGGYVNRHQSLIKTPAIVRTWIQCYNTGKNPSVIYDASKISEQIQGLYDAGLTGGYMTWNSASSLDKYMEVSAAFKKEY
ncbi:MAG TPA: hypothetical protein GX747_02210, partial [Tenericutes bacterium]|nr:hypothetical protein [Mycoplasmatota bacterium]